MNLLTQRKRLPGQALVCAIGGGGGGAGRTTTVAELSRHLMRKGRKVVVVDADLTNPALTTMLGIGLDQLQRLSAGTGRDACITGWIRFSDGRPVDAHTLPLFADAFPPPLFSKVGYIGWVPTIELTVHVRRRPVEGWIRGHFRTTDAAGNRTIEDGWLWDESGALVAVARQVGLVLSAQPNPPQ